MTRLRKWWVRLCAPSLESALCPWCGATFLPIYDVQCEACRDAEMQRTITQLQSRASVG